jgi:hypothetical protein
MEIITIFLILNLTRENTIEVKISEKIAPLLEARKTRITWNKKSVKNHNLCTLK